MTVLEEPGVVEPPATAASAPETAPVGMQRVRIAVLTVLGVLIGGAAGAIFDQWMWSLVAAPVAPGLVALLTAGRPTAVRAVGAVGAVVGTVALVVATEGGGVSDVADAFTAGAQRVLSTEWPSPVRADLVGTVAAAVAVATAAASELATRRRWHLLPLLPLAIAYVLAVAASAPSGLRLGWLFAVALVAIAFAALRPDDTVDERLAILRGEHRIAALIAIAVGLAALVSVPVAFSDRADPRDDDPPARSSPLLDPIEATLALRELDPPIILHTVESGADDVGPARWRTAALANYDGQRWTPAVTLLPIGRTLGAVDGPAIAAEVTFLDDSLRLVPLTGAPVRVSAAVETDPDRTVVRLVDPVDPPETITVVSNLAPTRSDAIEVGVAPRAVDDESSAFTELAERLGGAGSVIEQLSAIEATMREDFVLDDDVQGGGIQRALIELFLRDTRRGTREQFATGFVLLARSLGVDARVATGFASENATVSRLELSSEDATVWPEIRLADNRWLALDPVPEQEATDASPPPLEPETQTPAAPQPPIAPPPDSDGDTGDDDTTIDDDGEGALSTAVELIVRGVAVVGLLLLPVLLVAGAIVGAKWRRRRRRRLAADPADRIRGAWASATDDLVDVGLVIRSSSTDRDIARSGRPLVGDAARELDRLAALSSAATFGVPPRTELLADDAAECLGSVERSLGAAGTRWQRLRWRLSLRSLRRSTRSPVSV